MAMSMPSEELQLLIAGYVLGDLNPEEAAEFERTLAQNPAIAAEVAEMQSTLETVYAPPELTPPPGLRSRILDAAQTEAIPSALGINNVVSLHQSERRFSARTLLELAAAAVIVALGITNYRLSQALQLSQAETEKYAALTYQLQATQGNSSASAKVVVDPNTLEGTIAVQNLPPLPPGKVYVLWTVLEPSAPFTTDDKDAILTQAFEVDDRGNFTQSIIVPQAFRAKDLVTKVAVTMEDAIAPQKHTGSPIMVAKL
ncbi:MAG: anti-sigma factor [Leptolyngbyaceae cyanobacterium bins.302]|nr:anti-sigma factor [Leptolyngbyaceae cyanobacterium bins.302]